ncbi:MAG TPA: hypothetical protein VJ866_20470 [Pyrinomonadaceae bacterium]|nr:hypothetical protein [Pyrinomonadaceae bacterium]
MRNLKNAARLAACAVLLLAGAQAQAKEWRRIVPLRTTRAQVVRRLGKPRGGYHELKTERAFIYYSGERCAGGEGWDVPRDTVVRIVVTPKTEVRLSALRLDMSKLKRSTDTEVTSHALYTDGEAGVTYEVFEGGGEDDGLLLHINFDPTAKDDKLLRCPAKP